MVYAFLDFLLIELPESFVMLMMGMAVFNLSLRQHVKRGVTCALVLAAAASLLTICRVPFEAKVIIVVPLFAAIAWVTLRLPLRLAFLFSLAAFIPSLAAEFAVFLLWDSLSISLNEAASHFPSLVGMVWTRLALVLLLVYAVKKIRLDLRPYFPNTKQGKYLAALVIVGGFELLLIMGAVESANLLKEPFHAMPVATRFPILHLTILILFIVLIVLFRVYLSDALSRVETETGLSYLRYIKDLVTTIRSIKHDAVNHYTAIEGFLKLGLRDLAADYIRQLLRESSSFTQIKQVARPQVSALLHVKLAQCVSERIAVTVEIDTRSQFSFMRTRDLVKLLGAVMDEAIRATLSEPEEKRYILFRWGTDAFGEFLMVEHSGTLDDPQKTDLLSDLIKPYGGSLSAETANHVTRLCLAFPAVSQRAKKLFRSQKNLDQNSSM